MEWGERGLKVIFDNAGSKIGRTGESWAKYGSANGQPLRTSLMNDPCCTNTVKSAMFIRSV